MIGRILTPPPNYDPEHVVRSVIKGRMYPVPDIEAVDDHIRDLQARIMTTPDKMSDLVRDYRADIDLLLGRRAYLMTVATSCS